MSKIPVAMLLCAAFAACSHPQPAAPAPMGLTGVLDEHAFAAMHQLKQDHAPAAQGTMIELAGQHHYLSLPKSGQPPFAAVLVIHEWWGLNEHIVHWTDRLAADGYAALAVDLYRGATATTPESAMAAMKAVDPDQAKATLLAAFDFLKTDPRVQAEKRASIGWCFGGGWSLQLALAAPELDAAVMYYGHTVTDAAELKRMRAPLLGIFGNLDKSIPPAVVDQFEAALRSAGCDARILRYDANHAFANPSGQNYDEQNAAAAWQQVRAFLASALM